MSSHRESDLVVVTGASGFVGMHVILKLLAAGYRVRGTVRDLAREAGVREVLARNGGDGARLSFVAADLGSDRGWDDAVRGARFVLHVASPLPSAPPDHPDDLIRPAREGTLRVLRAASAARVERVVLTSSTAAVLYGHARDGSEIYDESRWSKVTDDVGAYERSKTLAERAAWDYVASLSDDHRFELVALLPGAILGPVLAKDFSVSGEIVKKLLTRDLPGCPDFGWATVDVRDVADAHVEALTNPRAAGKRFILAGEHVSMGEIARILAEHFGPLGYDVPQRRLADWMIRLVSVWDKTARLALGELGKRQDVSSARAREILGFRPRTVEQMVVAMAESMIDLGVVAPRRKRAPSGAVSPRSSARP